MTGSIFGFIFAKEFTHDRSCIENTYLTYALKSLSNVEKEKRIEFISNSSIFHEAEEITSLSTNNRHYYWFTWSSNSQENIGLKIAPNVGNRYFGFYIVISNYGDIYDFGKHKP